MDMDDERWRQVQAREHPRKPFVYAVRTTGIFCRPTCSSRRPLRTNVTFFDAPAQARDAGYRACLRCAPEEATSARGVVDPVAAACRAMLEHGGPLTAAELRRVTGLSQRTLSRAFATVVGTSAKAFGDAVRTGTARTLLRSGEPVTDAVFGAGYGSLRAFYETAAPTLGMTPSAYAGGAAHEQLSWTSTTTPVGELLAVASTRGLCAVRIGSDVATLLEEVRAEFPAATLVAAHEELADVAAALAHLASGRQPAHELPLDVRGTAFQARVWAALTRIPAGETRSYADVAAEIGAPQAVRAVAGACARNRVALVVPCHRVVRSDGALGGYRWGITVKQSLLEAERTCATAGTR
ncbi:methylated-DNA--[protein]-cysteine S-methyltransferase [Pseudokineococcus sp. 1T1Z-3]|uniref:methylated-DNA--[protein]-cysteine S-methyltransferase n=1 Tax=Pseudokineococcus sp. 1T1Z-3 TaxID=3132745 RepID=UPI0030A1CBEC